MAKLDELERLARLRDQGALTEEEFQAQKAALFGTQPETTPAAKTKRPLAASARANKVAGIGCGALLLLAVGTCAIASHESPEEAKARQTADADKVRKGFNCLSEWDGSNESLVDQVKANLRDPDSFDHEETRITPADKDGDHAIIMKYRAANGFGGKNVETVIGTVHKDCSATIITG